MASIDTAADAPQTWRPLRRFLARMTAWTVIAGVALVVGSTVVVPRIGGGTSYTVLTGSMQPSLPPGTVVVVRPRPDASIGVGSVITYQLESGKPTVVTHRVVSQGVDGAGKPVWWTQGDANDAVDPAPVRPVQVKGEVWYSVPYLGYAGSIVSPGTRAGLVVVGGIGLLVYSGAMFVGAFRDRRSAVT